MSAASPDPAPLVGSPEPNGSGSETSDAAPPRKGPLSFLSGALTSGLLAWFCLGLSQKVLAYYALHPPHYKARVAQSLSLIPH